MASGVSVLSDKLRTQPDPVSEQILSNYSKKWISQILWPGPPPSTEHLRKYMQWRDPIMLEIPTVLLSGGVLIERIEISGVPTGAKIKAGVDQGFGIWMAPSADIHNLVLLPSNAKAGPATLIYNVIGTEDGKPDQITNMAMLELEIPPRPPKLKVIKPVRPAVEQDIILESKEPDLSIEQYELIIDTEPEEPTDTVEPEEVVDVAEPVDTIELDEPDKRSAPDLNAEIKPAPSAELQLDTAPAVLSVGGARQRTGKLVLRLGGAPEYGGPCYYVTVDGQKFAEGVVDWALGLLDVRAGEVVPFYWQEVELPWDFDTKVPTTVGISYDNTHTGNQHQSAKLAVDWVNIDGVQISPKGRFTKASGGYRLWPKQHGIWSWTGDLMFDVNAAFGAAAKIAPATPEQSNG